MNGANRCRGGSGVQGRATQQLQWVLEILLTADGKSATQIGLCPFSNSAHARTRSIRRYSIIVQSQDIDFFTEIQKQNN